MKNAKITITASIATAYSEAARDNSQQTPCKAALFDKAHTTLYLPSIVTMPLSITVSEI